MSNMRALELASPRQTCIALPEHELQIIAPWRHGGRSDCVYAVLGAYQSVHTACTGPAAEACPCGRGGLVPELVGLRSSETDVDDVVWKGGRLH